STIARPGHAHYCNVRSNRERGRIEFTVCRCRNPANHGQAFCSSKWFPDIYGRLISWEAGADQILELVGRESLSRAE
ncbi:hypothetical protein BU26DRAFT_391537, partial [Trematosphaeria pertusa]